MQGERRKASECGSETTRGSDVDISQTRGTGGATGSSALFMRDGSTNLPLKHSGPIRHGAKCRRRDNARPFTFTHNYRIGRLTVLILFFQPVKGAVVPLKPHFLQSSPRVCGFFCVSEGLEMRFLP